MPFICGADRLTMKDGSVVKKGQPVPEADEWAYNIQQANLRLGFIIKTDGTQGATKTTPSPVTSPVAVSTSAPQSSADSPAADAAAGVSVKQKPQYGKGGRR